MFCVCTRGFDYDVVWRVFVLFVVFNDDFVLICVGDCVCVVCYICFVVVICYGVVFDEFVVRFYGIYVC